MVGISQGGADHAIRVEDFLDGQTIDAGTLAAAAADTDRVWVGQGSSTMTAQTFSAIWTWMRTKLPGYRRPVVEIAANTTLDGSLHNDAILVCSQPVTLTPAFVNMGSGFACSVINVSGGAVTFAAGITTSSGSQTLDTGLAAELRAVSYSGGTAGVRVARGCWCGLYAAGAGDRPYRWRGDVRQRGAVLAGAGHGRPAEWLSGELSGDLGWRGLDVSEHRLRQPDRVRPGAVDAV